MFSDQTAFTAEHNEISIWKTLTLASLAKSAAVMATTFEQGPPQVLAQEFSAVIDRLHENYAIEGDVHVLTLMKCVRLADDLKKFSITSQVDVFRKELAAL